MQSFLFPISTGRTHSRRIVVRQIVPALVTLVFTLVFTTSQHAIAQQNADDVKPTGEAESSSADAARADGDVAATQDAGREQKLAEYLSGATFAGKFTVDGKEDALPKTEQYTISKCEKLPEADMYRLTARIKYGETDNEVPLDIKILWSGNTPVITLDSFWIPGMGTFGARVLINSGRYAGTWQHDAVGGHMFGKIKK
jgi:hypothetical protein